MDEKINSKNIHSITPPPDVFAGADMSQFDKVVSNAASMPIFTGKITIPPEGGMNLWYKGMPFPMKGFHYPEASLAINMVKRQTMLIIMTAARKEMILPGIAFAILPWKMKKKFLINFIHHYCRQGDYIMNLINTKGYLQEKYMSPVAQEIHKFVFQLFFNLDVPFDVSKNAANIFSHLIEWDDAYRYRIEDLMSETSKSELKIYPQKAIRRLVKIFSERDKDGDTVTKKFRAFGNILSIALYNRHIRKAFDIAIDTIDIKKMQLDEADRYHVLRRDDYDFFGKSNIDRYEMYKAFHPDGNFPPMASYQA